MSENDYTFVLMPGAKIRYNAGPYDQATHSPRYEIALSCPTHVAHQIHEEQFLMGAEGHRIWMWAMENQSTWPVFVLVKKDGMLVREND